MRVATFTLTIALLAGILLAGASTHAAAVAPQPTATYVSELGPASVRPPQHAIALPGAGFGSTGLPWAKIAGLGLAICGALMIHAALTLRPTRLNPS